MSTNAQGLRRDIEAARGELGSTLEEIGDRVAPKKVVARTKSDIADKVDEVKEKVSPRRLLGAPVRAVRSGVRNVVGAGERLSPDSPGAAVEKLRNAATDGAGTVRDKAEGNPMAAGLFAFAAGFLAASLLPPSRQERELIERAKAELQPLADEAAAIGKDMATTMGDRARIALERVKETAGESAEEVRAEAESSVREVKGRAKAAAGDVGAGAKSAARRVKGEAAARPSPRSASRRPGTAMAKAAAAPRRRASVPARSRSAGTGTSRAVGGGRRTGTARRPATTRRAGAASRS